METLGTSAPLGAQGRRAAKEPVGERRILVLVNKAWEGDALMSVLLAPRARPEGMKVQSSRRGASDRGGQVQAAPRASHRAIVSVAQARAEIWCIQDLMNPKVSSSSTAEKARVLGALLDQNKGYGCVVAVGT